MIQTLTAGARRVCSAAAALALASTGHACAPVPVDTPRTAPAPPTASTCCTALERGVLEELNRARTNPARFAAELEARLPHFRGSIYRRPGAEVGVRTVEGAAAVREAVRVLRATRPLAALRLSHGMSAGAADHVRDHGPRGGMGHAGRDGSTPAARVNRYGRWFGVISENIQYGRAANAHEVIADLVIDDGVSDRGHRRNALDPAVRVAGVSCGSHATYGQMCVIVHASDYSERAQPGVGSARAAPGR
ncbi:MAG: CAP domain-containing protein [Gemmatimonadaceae bacterium]